MQDMTIELTFGDRMNEATVAIARWGDAMMEALAPVDELVEAFAIAVADAFRAQYVAEGAPCGPADDMDNVLRWMNAKNRISRAEWDRHDRALERWAVVSTVAQMHGDPIPAPPEEPA